MSTLVRPAGRTDGQPPTPPQPAEPSQFDAWRTSWALALRMARRDVRRHKGRSALVVVMVTIPTMLLAALVTLYATSEVSGTEVIPSRMGSGQALIEGPDRYAVYQDATTTNGYGTGSELARTVPGFDLKGDAFTNADAVSRLVGAPVVPTVTVNARTMLGERRLTFEVTALDGRVGLGDKLQLVSGRWPEGDTEGLVTEHGVSQGLPDAGRLVVSVGGTDHTVDIVGVAAFQGMMGRPGLVVADPLGTEPVANAISMMGSGSGEWIVTGDAPVTWSDVLALNEYGFQVTSAAVLADPPSQAELSEEVRGGWSQQDREMRMILLLGVVMLLLITALLVGPAFAVSAARQRRTLALVASNGASTTALRRTVLAQALVLGAASAVLGVVLGVVTARLGVAWTRRDGGGITGPFDIRWGLLVAITLCAVVSTVVAALIPARRLGRLDIVGVMRGQSVSPRPNPVVFAAGLLFAAAGTALLGMAVAAVTAQGTYSRFGVSPDTVAAGGAIALVVGTLFLLPMILSGIGRVGGSLPTPLRMAARDLARHRSRSTPTVAAILAAVAGLTMALTGLESDVEQQSREYLPRTIAGEALVVGSVADLKLETVRGAARGLEVTENFQIDTGDPWLRDEQPVEPFRLVFANVVPQGCTPERTISDTQWRPEENAPLNGSSPCQVAGTSGLNGMTLTLADAEEIVRRLELTGPSAQAVRDGGAVVRGLPDTPASGTVRIVRGTTLSDPVNGVFADATDVKIDQDVMVPVVALPQTKDTAARMLGASLMLATDTPTTRDWPLLPQSITIREPTGAPVSDDVAAAVERALGNDAWVPVERGFERDDALGKAILIGVFCLLVLVVTLTSTALTLAEQQNDNATMAALGATRGTRRVLAAAQGFMLAVVGCVLGVAVGLIPGNAIARMQTAQSWDAVTGASLDDGGIVVIPWLSLLIVGVLVPMVAGAIAWAGIRKAPQVTRRTT